MVDGNDNTGIPISPIEIKVGDTLIAKIELYIVNNKYTLSVHSRLIALMKIISDTTPEPKSLLLPGESPFTLISKLG